MARIGRLSLCATVVAHCLTSTTAAEQKPLGDSSAVSKDPFNDEFAEFARETLEHWKVPGVSIAAIDGDDVYAEGYGFASFPDTHATPETIWYGASTSKAHLAAVLSHLIDTKEYASLSAGWMTTISSLIRDDFVLQDDWATVHLTLDDAVSHRTGMPRHDKSFFREVDGRPATPKDIVRNMRNLAMTYPPRVSFYYCNLMFVTLSHVVEAVTGKWLGDVLRETIWEPLGMNSTYFDLDEALAAPGHFAKGYKWDAKKEIYNELPMMTLTEISGAGAVMSTALDYAKWVKCLLHETAPFSAAVHRDIRTPRMMAASTPAEGLDFALYGLGWQRTLFRGHVVYTHNGGMHAYGAEVFWLPDHKYGFVAFGNTALTSNAAEQVMGWRLIQDKLGIPREEQFDFNAKWDRLIGNGPGGNRTSPVDTLYPDRPDPPLPPTVNTSSCVGTYYDAGYGTLKLREQLNPENEDEMILIASRPEMTWNYELGLHHVSGDYWIVYASVGGDADSLLSEFMKGWFILGVDGKISALNIHWGAELGDMDEGITSFERVD